MATYLKLILIILVFSFLIPTSLCRTTTTSHLSNTITRTTTTASTLHLSPSIYSLCSNTPYPERCLESSKFSISIIIGGHSPTGLLTIAFYSLQHALSEALKLGGLVLRLEFSGIVEKERGAILDCKELYDQTVQLLRDSIDESSKRSSIWSVSTVQTWLSAALTNKRTCLDGLESANGWLKPLFVNGLESLYQLVSNALASFTLGNNGHTNRRRLLQVAGNGQGNDIPAWLAPKQRRLLQSSDQDNNTNYIDYDPSLTFIVAQDGSGNYSTIMDAINASPNNSIDRVIVYVKQGTYKENVEIPSWKPNIALLGDGIGKTVISGNRSVGDGWTTFRSATVAVSGIGFFSRDMTFRNTAGPEKHQAVALRVNADLAVIYRCSIEGYQDTLYLHSLRQFYRENIISGTIDFLFGNAAAVLQACKIKARKPLLGQSNAVTAQSRDDPNMNTGFSIQNCSIISAVDLQRNVSLYKTYLGRPWRNYSRTVVMESFIGSFVDPTGWSQWTGDQGLDTLYYGEYANHGPGSNLSNRVNWTGFHVMDYPDAVNFTISNLILGDQWLDSTAVPYDNGV